MSAPNGSKNTLEKIQLVLSVISLLTGLFIGIPTLEEAFNTVLMKYLLPSLSAIIATVILFAIIKKMTRG